jgi:ribonuclease P protein component
LNQGNTFTKRERISLKREIDLLFAEGHSFVAYPFRALYLERRPESGTDAALLISVPKRKLRRAVWRNRVKRLVREVYRLNRNSFVETLSQQGKGAMVAIIFIGGEIPGFRQVEDAVKKVLDEIISRMNEKPAD